MTRDQLKKGNQLLHEIETLSDRLSKIQDIQAVINNRKPNTVTFNIDGRYVDLPLNMARNIITEINDQVQYQYDTTNKLFEEL